MKLRERVVSIFALKFKNGSIVEEDKAAVLAHKHETSIVVKGQDSPC